MTTIYRPAGYGPSPTQEEHTAAPWEAFTRDPSPHYLACSEV